MSYCFKQKEQETQIQIHLIKAVMSSIKSKMQNLLTKLKEVQNTKAKLSAEIILYSKKIEKVSLKQNEIPIDINMSELLNMIGLLEFEIENGTHYCVKTKYCKVKYLL